METKTQTKRNRGRKLSKEEFRSLLPEKINKFGEWMLGNKDAWDYGNGKIVIR